MSGPYDLFHQPPMEVAIKQRDTVLVQVQVSAGAEFSRKAQEFVLKHLANNGATAGEDITDVCKQAGIVPPKDDRAFGPVFMGLLRNGFIRKVGTCKRRKGHATSGGSIYALNK